jgi:hypothetical protein
LLTPEEDVTRLRERAEQAEEQVEIERDRAEEAEERADRESAARRAAEDKNRKMAAEVEQLRARLRVREQKG